MSQQYDNNMSGVLFKNERKTKETHPGYQGSCEIDGVEMWISAWVKEGKNGKFFSLAFKPKDEQPAKAKVSQSQRPMHGTKTDSGFDAMDDDIPFSAVYTGRAWPAI
jgi:hypothetical protein